MVLRSCIAAVVCVLLFGGIAPARAETPSQERLVVVETIAGGSLSANGKERLHKEIGDVVVRNGLLLLPTETLPDRLQRCEIPGCLPQIAAASGAMLVLAVDGHFAKESFKLSVALWNADDGKILGKDTRDCPICDEQDLWGTAALVTQGLLEHYVHQTSAARDATANRALAVASPAPTVESASDGGSVALYSGLGLIAAGLATLAVGTYYIHVDGESACTNCDRVRDTRKYGVPLAIVGGVAAASGAGLLTWSLWPQKAQLSLGPTGVQLAGRFQ